MLTSSTFKVSLLIASLSFRLAACPEGPDKVPQAASHTVFSLEYRIHTPDLGKRPPGPAYGMR